MLMTSAALTGDRWHDRWHAWAPARTRRSAYGLDVQKPPTQGLPGLAAIPTQTHGEADARRLITFVEPDESFLSQSLHGFAWSVATLGVFSFWARAEARRKLTRCIRVDGDPLDYTGTGGEGLAAFILAALTTVVLVSTFFYFFTKTGVGGEQTRAVVSDFRLRRLFVSLPMLFLLGSAAYRRRKHTLRRTWWRGERFDLDGHPYSYACQHFWTAFLVPLTLGWAAPWRAAYLERCKTRDMHHGADRFAPNDAALTHGLAPLYRAFAKLWVGGGTIYVITLIALGLSIGTPLVAALHGGPVAPLLQPGVLATGITILVLGLTPVIGFLLHYQAAWTSYRISNLVFDGHRLHIDLPRGRFAALLLGSTMLKLVTLGALQPVANAAVARFLVARITVLPSNA